MPKRQKCDSCSSGWCKNHLFELKPLLSSLYFRKIQKVRLCPRLNKSTKNFQVSLPLINKDQKYYTPSFILEEEKSFYNENDQKMLKNHEEKIDEMVQGLTGSIFDLFQWVAKHGRKRKYCTVCHVEYEDYLQHISESSHKEKINKNRYTLYMKQMAAQYERKRARELKAKQILAQRQDSLSETHDITGNEIKKQSQSKILNIIDDDEEEDINYLHIFNQLQNFSKENDQKDFMYH